MSPWWYPSPEVLFPYRPSTTQAAVCCCTRPVAHHAGRVQGIRRHHRQEAHRAVVGGIAARHRTDCAGGCRSSEARRSSRDRLGFVRAQVRHNRLECVSIHGLKKRGEKSRKQLQNVP
jgi:hypothetical protein